jgi:integrase
MAGTYVKVCAPKPAQQTTAVDRPTFSSVAAQYAERHIKAYLSPGALKEHDYRIAFMTGIIVPPGIAFTEKAFDAITLEDIDMALTAKRMPTPKEYRKDDKTWTRVVGGDVSANRLRDHLCGLWNWALSKRYAEFTPFNRAGRVPDELKKTREHHRTRRLAAGEEARLLAAAEPHLKDYIIAALETGMRKAEILSLQWRHVRWLQNELALDWKTRWRRRRDRSRCRRQCASC